jgi:hypothetical protein
MRWIKGCKVRYMIKQVRLFDDLVPPSSAENFVFLRCSFVEFSRRIVFPKNGFGLNSPFFMGSAQVFLTPK